MQPDGKEFSLWDKGKKVLEERIYWFHKVEEKVMDVKLLF